MINFKTARAAGLGVPASMFVIADVHRPHLRAGPIYNTEIEEAK